MYCAYQDRRELEDDLYQENEGDSDGSEANSELEFHLYSQLHYSSNAEALEQREDGGEAVEGRDSQQPEGPEKAVEADGEREHTGESRSPSPDLSKLLQLLRKKKKEEKRQEKLNKQKTGNRKGPRSFSSFIEEVIVIDSSPDVISISEDDTADDDDDEGVCTVKGRSVLRPQTSTPAQQGSQKQSIRELVTLDSSTSESDSSDSDSSDSDSSDSDSSDSDSSESDSSDSDSSDSDDLQNWMILGRGKQDGDQSISLNLEGASDSNEDAKEEEESGWLVSTKDKESGICNRDKGSGAKPLRMSNRYYTNKNVNCRNCNKNGHISHNCPESKKLTPCYLCGDLGHVIYKCPKKHCHNCGLPGHLHGSCSEKAHWQKRCKRCGIMGHLDDACPEIWRQYHITTKAGAPTRQRREDQGRTQQVYCYNCSRRHFGHVCKLRRMFNGTYPSTPFINHYDVKKDIAERTKRIALKVNELKKKGIFLTTSFQTPPTPQPPNKKQKVGHHNNHHHHHYHQPNHTPRQSPNNHRANHTFFNDSDFVEAAASKPKKNNKHKQQESHVKPWKPKRPVPASKDHPPKAKLIVDEAKDFPRGGGKGEDAEKKGKGKKASKRKRAPEAATSPQGSASKKPRGNRKSRARKNADKKPSAQMYPADENLFIIKQRKGKK